MKFPYFSLALFAFVVTIALMLLITSVIDDHRRILVLERQLAIISKRGL